MDIEKYFAFESPIIPNWEVMKLSEGDLDNLYKKSNEIERVNIFFNLLNEYIYLKNQNALKETAHICYLISYYVFTPLTPPHSESIAMEYAKKALKYDNNIKYSEWIKEIKQGN